MIVLDTNVISELMRAEPDQRVFAWVDAQERMELYTTTVVQAEILYGVACLAPGHRRNALAAQAGAIFDVELAGRVLPFTAEAAQAFADLAADRRRQGRAIPRFDGRIAACALAFGTAIATRDVGAFEDCGLSIINPWDTP
ncbi:MAG: type II toxin-antitoxin system VapC family toxin [Alphaproteobacteria bacterium]|nr:MAG: type II toxin-antitoxin system VapC family toxin [Alphaproteobacteria bacterium]